MLVRLQPLPSPTQRERLRWTEDARGQHRAGNGGDGDVLFPKHQFDRCFDEIYARGPDDRHQQRHSGGDSRLVDHPVRLPQPEADERDQEAERHEDEAEVHQEQHQHRRIGFPWPGGRRQRNDAESCCHAYQIRRRNRTRTT